MVLGWMGVFGLADELRYIGAAVTPGHVIGRILYTLGAVVYARKRPGP